MLLYHGSNVEVQKPKLLPTKRLLDFGAGFYLTSDLEQASKWASRTTANRTGKNMDNNVYDVVIGPVANDQAIRTVNNYLKGYFSEDIAIQLLLPQRLKDQYSFRTERALDILEYVEVKRV